MGLDCLCFARAARVPSFLFYIHKSSQEVLVRSTRSVCVCGRRREAGWAGLAGLCLLAFFGGGGSRGVSYQKTAAAR